VSVGRMPAPHMMRAWAQAMRRQSLRLTAKAVGRPVGVRPLQLVLELGEDEAGPHVAVHELDGGVPGGAVRWRTVRLVVGGGPDEGDRLHLGFPRATDHVAGSAPCVPPPSARPAAGTHLAYLSLGLTILWTARGSCQEAKTKMLEGRRALFPLVHHGQRRVSHCQ
jgi:hypothetical protein